MSRFYLIILLCLFSFGGYAGELQNLESEYSFFNPEIDSVERNKALYHYVSAEHSENVDSEIAFKLLQSPLPSTDKLSMLEVLLEHKVSPNSRNAKGDALLHQLVMPSSIPLEDREALIALLIEEGADLYAKDALGNTALHRLLAAEIDDQAKLSVATLFLVRGFDVNVSNAEGQTPLHVILNQKAGDLRSYLTLLSSLTLFGADLEKQDASGLTPLGVANANKAFGLQEKIQSKATVRAAYEVQKRKLLANLYGLKGSTEVMGEKIPLEGLFLQQAHDYLSESTDRFYDRLKRELSEEDSKLWKRIEAQLPEDKKSLLKQMSREQKDQLVAALSRTQDVLMNSTSFLFEPLGKTLERIDNDEMVGFKIVGSRHLMTMVVYKGKVYLGNKGYLNILAPGVVVLDINKEENLPFILKGFKLRQPLEELIGSDHDSFFGASATIAHLLGSKKPQVLLKQKPQKVGNCSIANSNSMELVILYLLLKEGDLPEEELARAIKSTHSKVRRMEALENYLELHSPKNENVHFNPDVDLLIAIANKVSSCPREDRERKEMVAAWANAPWQTQEVSQKVSEALLPAETQ